jgi:hypothetical protein
MEETKEVATSEVLSQPMTAQEKKKVHGWLKKTKYNSWCVFDDEKEILYCVKCRAGKKEGQFLDGVTLPKSARGTLVQSRTLWNHMHEPGHIACTQSEVLVVAATKMKRKRKGVMHDIALTVVDVAMTLAICGAPFMRLMQ